MKIINQIILSAALAALLCAGASAGAADTTAASGQLGNPVIARGKGLEITRGDLDDAMAGYKAQIQSLSPTKVMQIQRQMLASLIDNKLLLAKATDADKQAGQKQADQQITATIENIGSQAALDDKLKANGLTEAAWRAKITEDATAQAVIQRELKVTVTDDEVQKYYESHTVEFEQPEMARISHILILTVDPVTRATLPAEQQLARRRLADSLVKAARAGENFDKLAQQYSEDPGSKANGGELPPFPRGQMVHEIDDAAFSMTNNQISDVITTAIGYQIIKLLEKIPSKKVDYLTAAKEIRQGLSRGKMNQLAPAYLDGLQKAAGVEILDPNLKAAPAPVAASATGAVGAPPATP